MNPDFAHMHNYISNRNTPMPKNNSFSWLNQTSKANFTKKYTARFVFTVLTIINTLSVHAQSTISNIPITNTGWIVPSNLVSNDPNYADQNSTTINQSLLSGHVFLPLGTYYISKTVLIPSFRKLTSNGAILKATSSFNPTSPETPSLIMGSGDYCSNISISRIEIDGSDYRKTINPTLYFKLIYLKNITNSKIENNILHGSNQTALMVDHGDGVTISDNFAYDNIGDGIDAYGGSQNIIITNNICQNNQIGIEAEGVAPNYRTNGIIINNNITRLNACHGILVRSCDNIIVSNNSAVANDGYGVHTLGSTHVSILNNNISFNGHNNSNYPADIGITSEGLPNSNPEAKNSNIIISNNIIGPSLNTGIQIDKSSSVSVTNNIITSNINSIAIGSSDGDNNLELKILNNTLSTSTNSDGVLLIISDIDGLVIRGNTIKNAATQASIGLRILGNHNTIKNFNISENNFKNFDYGVLFTDGLTLSRGIITSNEFSNINTKDFIGIPTIVNSVIFSSTIFDKGPDSQFPLK